MDILKSSKELSMAELNYTNWDIFLKFFLFYGTVQKQFAFFIHPKKGDSDLIGDAVEFVDKEKSKARFK